MSIVHGDLGSQGICTPNPFVDILYISTTITLEENIKDLFFKSAYLVATQLGKENKLKDLRKVRCIFSGDNKITFSIGENCAGEKNVFITYPIKKWDEQAYNNLNILTIFTEEFCHHFWNIDDEVEVKQKVLEVLQNETPELTLEKLYVTDWMEEYKTDKSAYYNLK